MDEYDPKETLWVILWFVIFFLPLSSIGTFVIGIDLFGDQVIAQAVAACICFALATVFILPIRWHFIRPR